MKKLEMELSVAAFVNQKWFLCSLASFLGFLLLSFCINQSQKTAPVLLQSLSSVETTNPLHLSGDSKREGALPPEAFTSAALSPIMSPSPSPSLLPTTEKFAEDKVANKIYSPPLPSTTTSIAFPPTYMLRSSSAEAQLSPSPSSSFHPSPSLVVKQEVSLNTSIEIQSSSEMNNSSTSVIGGVDEQNKPTVQEKLENKEECNLFEGKWVYDPKNYPLYRAGTCPFLSVQVSCQKNGRPDSEYQHWRWEPTGCKLPRFNGRRMLKNLRGKRVVIVGDSLNRNQWESLSCLLYSSARRSRARTAVKTKSSDYKIFRAIDYNLTVEFFWNPFIVKLEEEQRGKILKLDKLSDSNRRWAGADVMVFNTGHWWTHRGKMRAWDYFEINGELVENMDGDKAYETALKTWSQWVDWNVDPAKTTVFFRSISPEHKSESWCYNQTYPITNEIYVQRFPKSMISIVETTIDQMRTPVKYLNITRLSEYRRDGHTSVYTSRRGNLLTLEQRKNPKMHADCSHWCLPGLPDTWNVLLYTAITRVPPTTL